MEILKEITKAKIHEHLGYNKSDCSHSNDYHIKQNRTTLGMGMEIIVPKDRKTTFESQVVRNARKIFRLRKELTVKTNFV